MDIRIPIGGMFSVVGGMLVVYGLVTLGNQEMYIKSLGYNVNLIWGGCMAVFGGVMFYFGRKKANAAP